MANWIRVASNGKIQFFYDDKATRMSVVSSMIKKDIFATVGGYRQSLIGADTEFYETVIMRYGRESIVRLLQPLILGLWGDSDLPGIKEQKLYLMDIYHNLEENIVISRQDNEC